MIYLQHINNLSLVATTAYPDNRENYKELTKQEYDELLAAIEEETAEQEVIINNVLYK